ncbi:hypothetical protein E4U54_001308 [Claviceps lovelessii]|nr:hypothetical protein E4U54_001308 [Claviceps lovelessii]
MKFSTISAILVAAVPAFADDIPRTVNWQVSCGQIHAPTPQDVRLALDRLTVYCTNYLKCLGSSLQTVTIPPPNVAIWGDCTKCPDWTTPKAPDGCELARAPISA